MKVMKNLSVCLAIATMAALSASTLARAGEDGQDGNNGGFGFTVGYRSYGKLDGTRISHDTNPGDVGVLPNANVPGSAGTTSLDGHTLNAFEIGVRFQLPVSERVTCDIDLAYLAASNLRDDHQNANDPRPAANAAFIYTKVGFGGMGGLAFTYHARNGFSVGVAGEVASFVIDSGWDRYSHDQSASKTTKVFPSVGPKVGFRADTIQLEFGVLFGKTISPIAAVQIMF